MAFDKPQSRNEAILQNMLGANNELEPPKSRVEALLQDIAGQMPEANPSEGTTTGTLERLKIGDDIYTVEGGGSGTSDYDALNNKPQIAGVTLSGDKSLADLGIASATAVSGILDGTDIDSFGDVETALCDKVDKVVGKGLSTNDYDDTEKAAVSAATTAIAGIKDGTTIDSFGDVETALGAIQDGQSIDSFADVESAIGAIEDGTTIDSFADVESALADKQDATDSNLQTTADTIVGAINEHEGDIDSLKSGFTALDNEVNGDATTYPYADVITINDAVPANLADCSVKVEPVQDLHGYDKPWVGGAGKNKLNCTYDVSGCSKDNGVYTLNTLPAETLSSTIGSIYLDAGTYIINGGQSEDFFVLINISGNYIRSYGADAQFEVGTAGTYNVGVTIKPTATTNTKIYPMVRKSTEQDDTWQPYTNICPISGHTEAVVTREGKNLLNIHGSYINRQGASGTYTISGDSITVTASSPTTAFAGFIVPIEVGETYTLSYSTSPKVRTIQIDEPISVITQSYYGTNTDSGTSFVASKPYILINFVGDTSGVTFSNIQLEKGSTPTAYKAYKGQQYTIALGDTIYGGTVDFETGVMRVDRALLTLDGTEQGWSTDVTSGGKRRFSNAQLPSLGYTTSAGISAVSNLFKNTRSSDYDLMDNVFILRYINNTNRIDIMTEQFADVTEWTTFLGTTNMQVLYMLATPTTIQLTPQQIQLLQGTNTLYASTGDISVSVNGVSGAIGSLTSDKQDKTDYALETTAKTVVGGINELNTLASAIDARTFANNTPVFFAPNWRGGQNYNDIVLNKLEKLRCGFLLTKAGIFPFQTNINGDGFIVDSNVNLTITNEGNNTYRFACAGEWYTTCLFMFLWDYR